MNNVAQSPVLDRRIDLLVLFDVTDGNPNGDPDAGNLPRVDPETLQGLVSDGCIKRKIRDYVTITKTGAEGRVEPGYAIYFQHRGVLNKQHEIALQAVEPDLPSDAGKVAKADAARAWMCANCYDVRAFGAVMTTGVNCGQVRGPVQFSFARSIDPIFQQEHSITRKSVTTEREAEEQIEKHGMITGTMGRKYTVPYALYRATGFVSAHLAEDTKFTEADLELLLKALREMWDHDRSAARGLMATRKLFVFEHSSKLGEAPAHRLFDLVKVQRKPGVEAARSFDDYVVTFDPKRLPQGVRWGELCEGTGDLPHGND